MSNQHRGWNITRATVGYDIQHPDYDPENEIDWRYGHADTIDDARTEIDRLLAEDAEWTTAANILKIGFVTEPRYPLQDQGMVEARKHGADSYGNIDFNSPKKA